ncbi:MAG: molybdopterin cofactor-binding domain-containing protein [Alphaproteobacteria bacterium]
MNKPLTPSTAFSITRRQLMKHTGFVAVGFSALGKVGGSALAAEETALPGDLDKIRNLGSWIRVNADGTVTLMVGKVELGQGVLTAVSQIAADELYIDFERLQVISGDTWDTPDEGTTAGSQSMPNCAPAVQQAAAEVRQILLDLASEKLGQPAEGLTIADGTIAAADGASITYWELVDNLNLTRDATGTVQPMPIAEHRYIGQSIPRVDLPAKMTGEAIYVQEYREDGMAHGRVIRPPTYAATLAAIDTAAVEAMPGVLAVVRDGSFLGVVAEREQQADAAMEAIAAAAQWNVESVLPGHDGIFDWLQANVDVVNEWVNAGTPGTGAVKTMEATYYRPYHMHGSIGTSCAVAKMGDDGVMTVRTHSQSVYGTARAIAAMLSMEEGKVRLLHTQGSGCYGHNMADDAAADAALLARAVPGRAVRLQYTREQEHRWEPYGSAMVNKLRAEVDAAGNVLDWNHDIYSTTHSTRPAGGDAGNLLSARYLATPFPTPEPGDGRGPNYSSGRNGEAKYVFPHQRMAVNFAKQMPLRVSATRGLGAFANVFAIESFMDELAHEAGVDPVEYRLRYLEDERARDVLLRAAEAFGWDSWQPGRNTGRGIGFAQYKNYATYCAVAMEVQVTPRNGRVRVTRAVAASDSGHMVNPDNIANQIEGGLIQSLSWALKEEVRFDDTRVLSEDWASYPILTFNEVPPVQVELIDRPGAPYLGTGEASQGPTAGALGNAVFSATGVRFRRLPLTPDRVLEGLRA